MSMKKEAATSFNPVSSSNRLKLGTFGTNGKGTAVTKAPDAYRPTWDAAIRAAQLADAAGFEALVAYARWKSTAKGPIDQPSGVVLDPFAWAAGIAQATSYSAVFATTHAPTIHPIAAAKLSATIDIISGGRFGLNVVGGWNRPELEMFGAPLAEHDERYDYLEEWLGIVERLWTAKEEFSFTGRFLKVKEALSMPQPLQKPRPVIMNAGGSGRGMRFACEHADMCFVSLKSEEPAEARAEINAYKQMARETFNREVSVWTMATVVQRDTREAAEAYLHYFAVEHEDSAVVDAWSAAVFAEAKRGMTEAQIKSSRLRHAAAAGGIILVGTADDIADRLNFLTDIGIDGCLLSWNDFDDGLPRFIQEVMPRLEQRGLREKFQSPFASA